MIKLKPCPFCGAKAEMLTEHYERCQNFYTREWVEEHDEYLPMCTKCTGMIESWFLDEAEAAAAWNRRA